MTFKKYKDSKNIARESCSKIVSTKFVVKIIYLTLYGIFPASPV